MKTQRRSDLEDAHAEKSPNRADAAGGDLLRERLEDAAVRHVQDGG